MKFNFLIYIIFCLFLLILLFIFSKVYFKNIESYQNCNKFFNKNSFCQFNKDTNKCDCRLQKDDIKYSFNSPETCCKENCLSLNEEECSSFNNEKCESLNEEECIFNNKSKKMPYYCNIGGICKEFQGTIINSHISANNCGTDPLNNQLLLPYSTKEECNKTSDICDKYNISTQSTNVNKSECLKDINCGFCTNNTGGGKCISGTISGPSDLEKYYYCTPYQTSGDNNYEYGDHVAYLLTPSPKY